MKSVKTMRVKVVPFQLISLMTQHSSQKLVHLHLNGFILDQFTVIDRVATWACDGM